jgi:hypothetical protein
MNTNEPHESARAGARCGAKTRSGSPCKRLPAAKSNSGRCNLHGGKSLSWIAHPNYKHGLYSKYTMQGIERRAGIARRKRERAWRKEDRYVLPKLQRWIDEQVERRGIYNIAQAEALARRLREEYRAAHGSPLPEKPAVTNTPKPRRRRPTKREQKRAQQDAMNRTIREVASSFREAAGLEPDEGITPAVEGLRDTLEKLAFGGR